MSTKIHIGLSTNYLHGACLSEGQRVDMKVFPTLWASGDWKDVNFVVADKGYDVYQVVKLIRDTGRQPIIPRRRNALFEGVLPQFEAKYRSRFAIEHFFSKLKENKRLALRFDKLDLTFFAFFSIACLKIFKLLC
jgi:transposase